MAIAVTANEAVAATDELATGSEKYQVRTADCGIYRPGCGGSDESEHAVRSVSLFRE